MSRNTLRSPHFFELKRLSKALGFTLVELMITVTIGAILIAIGTTSMVRFIQQNRLDSAMTELQSTLKFARTEAIRTGQIVVISGIRPCTGTTASGQWFCGWQVFIDSDNSTTLNGSETVLRNYDNSSNLQITHTAPTASTAGYIQIDANGRFTQTGARQIYFYLGTNTLGSVCVTAGGGTKIVALSSCP